MSFRTVDGGYKICQTGFFSQQESVCPSIVQMKKMATEYEPSLVTIKCLDNTVEDFDKQLKESSAIMQKGWS